MQGGGFTAAHRSAARLVLKEAVVSGNTNGGSCLNSDLLITNSTIGLDITRQKRIGNRYYAFNKYGGGGILENSVISGGNDAIRIMNGLNEAKMFTIRGCYVGLDGTGKRCITNSRHGIDIRPESVATIGGPNAKDRNFIACSVNRYNIGCSSPTVLIEGNTIGPYGVDGERVSDFNRYDIALLVGTGVWRNNNLATGVPGRTLLNNMFLAGNKFGVAHNGKSAIGGVVNFRAYPPALTGYTLGEAGNPASGDHFAKGTVIFIDPYSTPFLRFLYTTFEPESNVITEEMGQRYLSMAPYHELSLQLLDEEGLQIIARVNESGPVTVQLFANRQCESNRFLRREVYVYEVNFTEAVSPSGEMRLLAASVPFSKLTSPFVDYFVTAALTTNTFTSASTACLNDTVVNSRACDVCDCRGTTVDCTGIGLARPPTEVPVNTTRLILKDNPISPRLFNATDRILTSTTYLDLSGCSISDSGLSLSAILKAFPKLSTLVLDNNPIAELPTDLIDYPSVRTLSLQASDISTLHLDRVPSQLVELALGMSPLCDISGQPRGSAEERQLQAVGILQWRAEGTCLESTRQRRTSSTDFFDALAEYPKLTALNWFQESCPAGFFTVFGTQCIRCPQGTFKAEGLGNFDSCQVGYVPHALTVPRQGTMI